MENLITMLSSLAQRRKKQLQLRNTCCEERVWRSHLNYIMAQAHLTLLYQSLDQMHGGALQHRFTHRIPATLIHLFCQLLFIFIGYMSWPRGLLRLHVTTEIYSHIKYELFYTTIIYYYTVCSCVKACNVSYDAVCALLRYSQLNPLCFSLANSGVLVWRNSQQPKSPKDEGVSVKDSSHSGPRNFVTTHNNRHKKEGEEIGRLKKMRKKTSPCCSELFVPCSSK